MLCIWCTYGKAYILKFVARQPTVSIRYPPRLCTPYIADVSLSRSDSCLSLYHRTQPKDVNRFLNTRPKTPRFQRRFYSRANRASLGLVSPTFTPNMCGQMITLMPFDLTINSDSFLSTCGPECLVTASQVLAFYQQELVAAVTYFLRTNLSGILEDVSVNTCLRV
jgi:hypothetical protein